ncbi:hypothetical protein SAMN05444672_10892 [Bacillus sp. OK838]|nr:hypothetical protein SAMN05444672_10892 [Bacillus sp. OK838]
MMKKLAFPIGWFEMKGKSLEEIEEIWREHDLAKAIKPA